MPRKPRLYITGDTHGDIDIHKLTASQWPEGCKLTKDDVLIIAGDFGLVFYPYKDDTEEYWLDWLDACPWTTLFIDGNHENFDRLYSEYPCEERYGGPVGIIRPSVLHLRQRGHVYAIAGKRFWCFGGATSIDKITPGLAGQYLEQVADLIKVKCWYFGHYHTDTGYDCETEKGNISFSALYRDIVRVH